MAAHSSSFCCSSGALYDQSLSSAVIDQSRYVRDLVILLNILSLFAFYSPREDAAAHTGQVFEALVRLLSSTNSAIELALEVISWMLKHSFFLLI
jgi:hypothetical protein